MKAGLGQSNMNPRLCANSSDIHFPGTFGVSAILLSVICSPTGFAKDSRTYNVELHGVFQVKF